VWPVPAKGIGCFCSAIDNKRAHLVVELGPFELLLLEDDMDGRSSGTEKCRLGPAAAAATAAAAADDDDGRVAAGAVVVSPSVPRRRRRRPRGVVWWFGVANT
jgi:hypothetical protein